MNRIFSKLVLALSLVLAVAVPSQAQRVLDGYSIFVPTTRPVRPDEGTVYQSQTDHKFYIYSGTAWVAVGSLTDLNPSVTTLTASTGIAIGSGNTLDASHQFAIRVTNDGETGGRFVNLSTGVGAFTNWLMQTGTTAAYMGTSGQNYPAGPLGANRSWLDTATTSGAGWDFSAPAANGNHRFYTGGYAASNLRATIDANGIALSTTNLVTTSTDRAVIANTTAATSGVPVQISPRIRLTGTAWNTTATAASNYVHMWWETVPQSGASTVIGGMMRLGLGSDTDGLASGVTSYPITIGSFPSTNIYSALWFGTSSPSATNFSFLAPNAANQTIINTGSGSVELRVANVTHFNVNNAGVEINGSGNATPTIPLLVRDAANANTRFSVSDAGVVTIPGSITGMTTPLTVAQGGTQLATLTAHALYVGNTTSAPTALAVGGTGTYLRGAVGADPVWSTVTLPNTVATGNVLIASATNVVSALTPGSLVSTFPANQTGNATATLKMNGLGAAAAPCVVTPNSSGRVMFNISGQIVQNTNADGIAFKMMYGTGAAPANGAAASGTQLTALQTHTALTGALEESFSLTGTATGLSLVATWFDLQVADVTGGTASITNVTCSALEF